MPITKTKRGAASHGQASKMLSVRIPVELHKKIEEFAKNNQCSKSNAITFLLSGALKG